MDSNHKHQAEQPSQNELDLGLSQVEPITPKKTVQTSESIFDKAKGLFGKKEQIETKFNVRKEPTFGESQVEPLIASQEQAKSVPAMSSSESQVEPSLHNQTVENESVPPVDPIVADHVETEISEPKESRTFVQPEKWKILQILPAKHRRLFIAILALVILLIVFFALKPNSDTVESFSQGNSGEIPVQFQSLDQDKPVENTILDHNVNETAPAEPAPQKMEYVGEAPQLTTETSNNVSENVASSGTEVQPQAQVPTQPQSQTVMHEHPVPAMQPVSPAIPKTTTQPVKKSVDSMVNHKQDVTASVAKKEVKAEKAEKTEKAQATVKNSGKAPIVEAKPVAHDKKSHQAPIVEAKSASSSASSKTLTVPKGVSLMQVFRDNHLNISDVNAMSKAAGAGNALSSFKPGDKVAVSVNSQGRVAELRMSNGARFIRQADGSYQYKK